MPRFRYKARDRSGVAVTGVVEAQTPKAVTLSLRELGYQIVSVEEFRGLEAALQRIRHQLHRPRQREVVALTRQLAMMVRAGLPLVDAIHGCASQVPSERFRKTLVLLVEDLKGGMSFSEALAKHPRFFSGFAVSMVRAGEAAGILDDVLDRLAGIAEEELELRGRIQSALTYPCLLVLMSLGIITFLLVAILPRFVSIFEEAGAALPLPTFLLLGVSGFLTTFWYLPPLLLAAAVFFLRRYAKTPSGRHRLAGLLLKIPILGDLVHKTILARFSRIMGSLLKSGVQAVAALTITQEVVGNQVVRLALEHIRQAVIGGSNLADPFRMSGVFPATLVQMISGGSGPGRWTRSCCMSAATTTPRWTGA